MAKNTSYGWVCWMLTVTLFMGGCSGDGTSNAPSHERADGAALSTEDVEGTSAIEHEDGGAPTDDVMAAEDSGPDTDEPQGLIQATHWCEAVLGAAAGQRALAQDLARVHVGQRLFGPTADWLGADATLVSLLGTDGALGADLLDTYADAFADICAADADVPHSSPVAVSLHGDVAVITPGEGPVNLPAETTAVVVDLRQNAGDDAAEAALAAAFMGELSIATRKVRKFHGFPAQDDGWTHYEVEDDSLSVSIQGSGAADLPLVILTPQRLTPKVATLVGGLRLLGRAGLAGHHVYGAVAESTWTGVGERGLSWRASTLMTSGVRWPDVVTTDLETDDIEDVVSALITLASPTDMMGEAVRSDLSVYDRAAGLPDPTLDRGAMRAALMVAYGTLDWFYAYFDLVGRDLDDALLAALDEVDETTSGDRVAMKHIMGRFMHDLYDGHGFYWDEASEDWPDGWMALQIQEIEGFPVVRASLTPDIDAGDTILAVDGQDIGLWYEEAMSRYSASSDGYRFVLATDELKEVRGTPQWTLRDASGAERTVTAQAADWEDVEAVPWGGTNRPSGWLTDLDAPDTYFVNMAASVTPDESEVVAELASAGDMAGVILDMRDYPYLDIYEFARTFNPAHFSAPLFGFPTWRGPWQYAIEFEAWEFDSAMHVVDAPVVLLVSHKSVSAAECFAQMVMGLDNVTVVGQQSASTNGTITTAWLPGQWEITFTGMRLTNPDGSEFHGIGVVPDVEVQPTPDQFAAGVDPELEVALEILGN